jgi:hypothetical protein
MLPSATPTKTQKQTLTADTPTSSPKKKPASVSNPKRTSSFPTQAPTVQRLQIVNSNQPTTLIPNIEPSRSPSSASTKKLFNNFDQGMVNTLSPTSSHFSPNNSIAAATQGYQSSNSPITEGSNLFLPMPLIALLSALLGLTVIGGVGLFVRGING